MIIIILNGQITIKQCDFFINNFKKSLLIKCFVLIEKKIPNEKKNDWLKIQL